MTTRKKASTMLVRVSLWDPEAKLFTSRGPLLHGSAVELPEEEARLYCNRGSAVPVLDGEEDHKLPNVNVEPDGDFSQPNPNEPGSFRVRHQRKLVDLGNATPRADADLPAAAEGDAA